MIKIQKAMNAAQTQVVSGIMGRTFLLTSMKSAPKVTLSFESARENDLVYDPKLKRFSSDCDHRSC